MLQPLRSSEQRDLQVIYTLIIMDQMLSSERVSRCLSLVVVADQTRQKEEGT